MGDEIGVELDDIAADVDYKPSEKESKRANKETKVRYEDRFESILTDWYDDKKNWWDAVEDCIKKDGDFSTRVSGYMCVCTTPVGRFLSWGGGGGGGEGCFSK